MALTSDSLIQVANRSQRWVRDHPLVIDVGFALLVFGVELVDLLASSNTPENGNEPDAFAIVLVTLGAMALIMRRQRPILTMVAVSAVMVLFYIRDYGSFMSIVGLAAFYAIAAHASRRRRAWIVMAVAACVLIGLAFITLLDRPTGFNYSGAAAMSTYICVSTIVGVITRHREQIFMRAEARAEQAEADRAQAEERAATQERLRIARELHDVVAHGMSVIAVQAAAAQEITHHDPDRAVELMKTVESTGRESLNEMRRMLGVLRNPDGAKSDVGTGRSPQPSIANIDEIVEHCSDAGLPVELTVAGEPTQLSPGLELTVFRITQEALTNVLKHGGDAARADVELSYGEGSIAVRVTDTGRGLVASANGPSAGNGLVGMRERVELYDGSLTAGPKRGGGYEVNAVLPLANASRPAVPSAEPARTEQAMEPTS